MPIGFETDHCRGAKVRFGIETRFCRAATGPFEYQQSRKKGSSGGDAPSEEPTSEAPAGTPEEVPNGHSGELRSFPNAKIYVNQDGTSIAGFRFFVFAEIV